MEARSTNTFEVSVWKRSAAGSVLTRVSVAEITLGEDGSIHISSRTLEQVGWTGQQELVLHQCWHGALGDAWLNVVRLDPL